MPEWVRSIAGSLREFVGNRRHAPRFPVRLPVSVSLLEIKHGADSSAALGAETSARSHAPSLDGQTHDISATGLAVVLPGVRIGERYLTGEGRRLRIRLELPDGALVLHAVPVRYEQLERTDDRTGYLIGARIIALSDQDRARLLAYLKKQG
jgi:hypothetical protein